MINRWPYALVVFLLMAALVYASYRTGFAGAWQFDDALNLGGLATVKDVPSAMAFVFGGLSSQLGRPLAVATFLFNKDGWPCCTEGFRQANTLIHLCNGLLVFVLARKVAVLSPRHRGSSNWMAVTLAGLWMAHPFLVSTNMMAVQRMTSLSATFVLLGLLGYMAGRRRLAEGRLKSGYAWMSLSLVGGALLGVLAKETAALLPLFAAVMELTVLRAYGPLGNTPFWMPWRWVFFASPLLLLVVYAIFTWGGIQHMSDFRPFDLSRRLASESVILWDYLRQTLVPDISRMGPYQDDAAIRNWKAPTVFLACIGWVVMTAGAWLGRDRQPLALFALGWFVVGHLLESTIFPLELYFEHRNYIPSLGPLALMAALLWRLPEKLAIPASAGLMAVFLFLNYQVAHVWGQPGQAAVAWYKAHPTSVRASKDLGYRFVGAGKYDAARRTLEPALQAHPLDGDLNMDMLLLHCLAGDGTNADRQFTYLRHNVRLLVPGNAMLETLHKTINLQREARCGTLDEVALAGLVEALFANPRIQENNRYRHVLHIIMSDIRRHQRDFDGTVRQMKAAFQTWPQIEVAQVYIFDLISAGLREQALAEIERARARIPSNPWERQMWLAKLDEMETMARKYEYQ